ncbi:MAG: fluoride efflux transporter CrcB [Holophagae bacterium]|jgi:CrcB protein
MEHPLVQALWVGVGGFVGTALRYLVSGWTYRLVPNAIFPWGTLTVNVVGCLMLGLLGGLADFRGALSANTRLFVFIGVLGGFTTFSTFAFETVSLSDGAQALRAVANVAGHLILGLGAAWLGYHGARLV